VTGIDTRIGFPGEHLASGMVEEVNTPMYATGAGLVIYGLKETPYGQEQEAVLAEVEGRTEKASLLDKKIRPATSFIYRIKEWFEDTMSNSGDFIE
jgi:cell division ATPase FtsA